MRYFAAGSISLNISAAIYCIYYIPQLWHNARRRRIARITGTPLPTVSWGLHICYVCSVAADLLYGFAMHLPWQYRAVSIIFMLGLIVQQIQLRPCRLQADSLRSYSFLCIGCAMLLLLSMLLVIFPPKPSILIAAGYISTVSAWLAFLPQIVRNYQQKHGRALSWYFICLTLLTAVLDFISALCLGWPLPSLIGPPIIFVTHAIALWQYCYWGDMHHTAKTNWRLVG